MNLDQITYCEIGHYDHEGTIAHPFIAPLNVTPAIGANFGTLFDLKPTDLALIRLLLCYRTELICILFLLLYVLQIIVISLTRCLNRLLVRQRTENYILKKRGVYRLDSLVCNSLELNKPDRAADATVNTYYIRPSRYVFLKKCLITLLIFVQLLEFYPNLVDLLKSSQQQVSFSSLIFSYPIFSSFIRLFVLILIAHHFYFQTQPPNTVVFNFDSLSPSVYSRASQSLISIFWLATVLNILLSILLFTTGFTVPVPEQLRVNSTQPVNSTLHISILDACSLCRWQTLPLPDHSLSWAHSQDVHSNASIDLSSPHSSLRDIVDYANEWPSSQFFFNWLYLWIFLAQLLLAFFPDFDITTRKNSTTSLDGLAFPDTKCKDKVDTNPEDQATFFSKLAFTWFSSTIFKGYRNPLTLSDIFPPSWLNRVETVATRFSAIFKRNYSSTSKSSFLGLGKFRLIAILIRQFGVEYLSIAAIKLVPTLLTFLSPILLDRLIQFVKNDEPAWHGFVYAVSMFALSLTESILNSVSDYRINVLALKIRSCLTAAIYERMLQSQPSVGSRYSSGQLVNIMSIDTQRVLEYVKIVNLFWICPLQISISIYMLWTHLGYGSLAGLAVLLLLLPFNAFIGAKLRSMQAQLLKFKDHRIKVLSEIISSIRSIKLCAWEEVFEKRLQLWRKKEVASLRQQAWYSTAITFAFNSAPFLVAFASFTLYLLINANNRLNAQKIFVSLAIFNIIRRPLAFFPQLITNSMMFMVSMKRIGEFLDSHQDSAPSRRSSEISLKNYLQRPSPSIQLYNCTFSWSSQQDSCFFLSNISLSVTEPKLCVIIGEIGAGKSSFLSAVLGQMNLLEESGSCTVSGTIAYVPQESWIQSGTVRENILFGKKYDRKWYQKVVEACALKKDFEQLTDGDQMIVGQKGFSLSGGQKQRISIARALYSNADLYLFDNPLSALDTHVAKHVFTRVIGPTGLLAGKIRLLVTHNMAILPRADHVILLKNGLIAASGEYRDLMDEENEFTDFLAGFLSEPSPPAPLGSAPIPEGAELVSIEEAIVVAPDDREVLVEMASKLERQFRSFTRRGSLCRQFSCQSPNEPKLLSFTCITSPSIDTEPPSFSSTPPLNLNELSPEGELIPEVAPTEQIEPTPSGSVSREVYTKYLRRVSLAWSSAIVASFFVGHIFLLLSQLWLSTWSSEHDKSKSFLRPWYEGISASQLSPTQRSMALLGVYGMLGLQQTVFILVGTLLLYIGCLRASRQLHNEMLARLLAAPIWFFDATSSSAGQILNRFTKDIDIADTTLISNFLKLAIELFRTLASFCLITLGTDPCIALIFIPLILVYFAIYQYNISTSRQLIRLESALRTPIYSFFTETFSGVSVIRAFGVESQFIRRNYLNIDKNASAYHMSVATSRWLAIRLELLGNLVVLITAMFCVSKRGEIDSGMVGLCMSCAFTVTSTLNMLIRSFTDLESNIVSIERLLEYTELPQEAARHLTESERQKIRSTVEKCSLFTNCVALCEPDEFCQAEEGLIQPSPILGAHTNTTTTATDWLQNGSISICQYSTRYRPNLELCLRGLNLVIEPGQKVAIVGRTGAGKSSFALALFRLIEAESGFICISGRNIKELGLHELRSSLTIIPQDPLLFSGSLRENMDPLGHYTDEQIMDALGKVNLQELLVRLCPDAPLRTALDQPLDEARLQSLSAGQKQLLCLARVLLRQPRVLIMDEATAAIDPATDDLVNRTIARAFRHCTVLSIAHRLSFVLRYPIDRVLVLDRGSVREYDSPQNLIANRDSLFYRMLQNRL